MAVYAVGDIQGCYDALQQLLERIHFNPGADQLWLVGDLVNRGPDSLAVLRLVKGLGENAVTVLGNHDLHLLAVAQGTAPPHKDDTLDAILQAPDAEELLHWLRHQRMLHVANNHVLIHAGLLPVWSVQQAQQLAAEVEAALRNDAQSFFEHMYGNTPNSWDEELSGYARLRVITNALTRMRICTPQGEMEFKFKGEPKDIPSGYLPWYAVPHRASAQSTVVCGHWSALGLQVLPNLLALDTGCFWGGMLTAIRLEDRQVFQVPCAQPPARIG